MAQDYPSSTPRNPTMKLVLTANELRTRKRQPVNTVAHPRTSNPTVCIAATAAICRSDKR